MSWSASSDTSRQRRRRNSLARAAIVRMLQSMTPRRYVPPVLDPALRTVHRVTDRFVPEVTRKPSRVWTLFRDIPKTPEETAKFVPAHNVNAFIEDSMHDWTWKEGRGLNYFSRVAEPKDTRYEVWILCEYAAEVQP